MEGSAPRDVQTKMVVSESSIFETIGGGNLEYQAIHKARDLIADRKPFIGIETFSLGRDLSQCCGGKVELLFEAFPACEFEIMLFGAGHVGRSLVQILAELPCRVRWFDARSDQFPDDPQFWRKRPNVEKVISTQPITAVESCPANAWYLVMTHSHETDYEVCEAILTRQDARFCGLIGSKSKAAKFRNQLSRKGFSDAEIAGLTCPIGLGQIPGKAPMAVSVSIAAQLLELQGQ